MKRSKHFRILLLTLAPIIADAGVAEFQIFNTGVDSNGNVQQHGSTDSNYELISGPIVTISPVVFKSSGGYPVGPWLEDNSSSAWITPSTQANVAPGDYIYKTTFDLTGFDPNTAQLGGVWTSDNAGIGVLLNGNPDADSFLFPNRGDFTALDTSFEFNSGFIDGLNSLYFKLNNAPLPFTETDNPTGLRVEFTLHSADEIIGQAPVPLPAAFWMLSTGLFTILGYHRSSKKHC